MEQQKRRKNDLQAADEFCNRFGTIAVRLQFVTAAQVKEALTEQVDDNLSGREHRLLGTILFDHGWITEHQIEAVLQELKKVL